MEGDDGYQRGDCDHDMYTKCEHKNWLVDPETEVRKVYSKWVENGSNFMLMGSHGNWGAGIKNDYECGENPDYDHTWCNTAEFDSTNAAGHQFDSRGFFVDLQPMSKRVDVRRRMFDQGLMQQPSLGDRTRMEANVLANMLRAGVISQTESDAMVSQLQQDYERLRRNVQGSRRYVTYPVRVQRDGTGRRTEGGVPYEPDFLEPSTDVVFDEDNEGFPF